MHGPAVQLASLPLNPIDCCCSSVVREFRYVAVLTAAQLVTSWIQVGGRWGGFWRPLVGLGWRAQTRHGRQAFEQPH